MAKVTAPFLGLGASGTVGKTITASRWKGRAYVRQRVDPANPQTVEQTKTRSVFQEMSQLWKNMDAVAVGPWDLFAKGQVLTGRNAMMGQNIAALRGQADLGPLIGSPGAKGGIAPSGLSPALAATTIDATVTAPAIPPGWSITQAEGFIIQDQVPGSMTLFVPQVQTDATDPYVLAFTGLTTATEYLVTAWLKWLKPDGTVAYGASTNALWTTS